MRRVALIYKTSRKTVKRKLEFLAAQARLSQEDWLKSQTSPFEDIQFDDLETFEHTKCKPVSVTLFVENKTRKVLGYTVSPIGAKGLLAKISVKKYGKRKNESFKNRRSLFKDLKPYISEQATIHSDESPYYTRPLKEFFPKAVHKKYKGLKGCVTGQGELKKAHFDPLFSINHTFAMLRANINRLFRRTWCTSKKLKALDDHIALYVDFHNQVLTA